MPGGKLRGFAHRIDITAGADRVWRALTEPTSLGRWCASGAAVRPRAGGSYRLGLEREEFVDAYIDVFEPERRLRLIHMERADLPSADATIVDDILLEAAGAGTIVRLLGAGYPEERSWDGYYLRQRTSWERALARLKVYLEKGLDRETT